MVLLKACGRGVASSGLNSILVTFHNRVSHAWPALQPFQLRTQLPAVFGRLIGRGILGTFLLDRISLAESDVPALVGKACTGQDVQCQNDDRSLYAVTSPD